MYVPAANRYESMPYRRVGASGLRLPALSLGLWHNFGDDVPLERQRAILRAAFDLGITHLDLANNYGPPFGSAEINAGRILREDFAAHRDELIISTKAGWHMWPGPYGGPGGSRKHVLGSLEASLRRLGLEHVDIFYSHRPDPGTPLEETMGALDTAVRQGKALYAGISSYSAADTRRAAAILRELGTPLLIHQPSYSMLNRWVETDGLLDTVADEGADVIAFSVLAQGMLSGRYLGEIPDDSRAAQGKSLPPSFLSSENRDRLRGLQGIAERRGQTLSQMALAWALRDSRVSSVLIGVSRVEQLRENVAALESSTFSDDELAEIDTFAVESGIDLWREARDSTASGTAPS